MTTPAVSASHHAIHGAAHARWHTSRVLLALLVPLALAGCDMLGIESGTQQAERKLGEGKATGAACRHAGRAIEDCYTLNKKADRAAVYAGWREMDEYMRENKLASVAPVIPVTSSRKAPKPVADEGEGEGSADSEVPSDAAAAGAPPAQASAADQPPPAPAHAAASAPLNGGDKS